LPSWPGHRPQQALSISILDVSQGDSIWLQTPDNHNYVVDGGEASEGATVASYLRGHGVTLLDAVILTHPDADHVGGLTTVLQAISTTEVIYNGQSKTTQAFQNFANEIQRQALPTVVVRTGNAFAWGCCISATVLNPSEPLLPDVNDNSVVLRVTYGSFAAVLRGDISTTAESAILGRGLTVSAPVLRVAHHGSRTSSGMPFLTAVRPAVAVISVGAGNSYGHPNQETLDRLVAVGATVYRTDLEGTIRVTSCCYNRSANRDVASPAAAPYPTIRERQQHPLRHQPPAPALWPARQRPTSYLLLAMLQSIRHP
jgi:competence protein ComEC